MLDFKDQGYMIAQLFFAPYAFRWYSYIPDAPKEIIAAIEYVNFSISLLLFGLSTMLMFMKRNIFAGSLVSFAFHVFLIFTWFCRIVITCAVPWPSSLKHWLLAGYSTEFILTLLPAVCLPGNNMIQYRGKKLSR